jgi:hypothetical protein
LDCLSNNFETTLLTAQNSLKSIISLLYRNPFEKLQKLELSISIEIKIVSFREISIINFDLVKNKKLRLDLL